MVKSRELAQMSHPVFRCDFLCWKTLVRCHLLNSPAVSASQILLRESRSRSNSMANGNVPPARTLIPRDQPLPRTRPLASISADLPDSCEGKHQTVSLVGYRKLAEPDPSRLSESPVSTIALGTLSPQPSPGSRSGSTKSYRKVAQSMPDLSGVLRSSSNRRKQTR